MRLFSTCEDHGNFVSFGEAVLSPLASFGGLYAPIEFPAIADLDALKSLSYADLCRHIFELFEAGIDRTLLDDALKSYDRFDFPHDPAPLKRIFDDTFVLELWHGPTRAFKDMALQPFGALLDGIAQKRGERLLIIAATSGDTGPATLETFANRANTEAICIYPHGGTSEVQRLQMVTPNAANLKTIAINGSFDDAQTALKTMLSSDSFAVKVKENSRVLSAANSVNFGRIIFQIIYHIHAYLALLNRNEIKAGEKIDIVVPSGNFGNALGAFYARNMGVPIAKIVIASNDNNILTDLIVTGRYDISQRTLIATTSPAMDILKSSNVERILFALFGGERTRKLMSDLGEKGAFELSGAEHEKLYEIFDAAWSNEREVLSAAREIADRGYIIDPHTATCIKALRIAKSRIKVICSTAEWTKFAPTIAKAVELKVQNDIEALNAISSKFDIKIHLSIAALFEKQAKSPTPIAPEAIEKEIIEFLKAR